MTAVAFSYRAARTDGTEERGTVDASSRDAASAALASRGLWVLDVAPVANAGSARRRLPAGDLALGLRLLASLLDAGLPLARALTAFGEVAPDGWRPAVPGIQQAVREGQSLGAALATGAITVPPVVLGMVQAGEAGSGLAPAVRRAAELTERAAATRAAVVAALVYPAILTTAGGASLILLVGVVLPRFAGILADLGQVLPPTTRVVLAAAAIARGGALPATVAVVVAVATWRAWVSTEVGRRQWHEWLLSLPLVGTVRRASAVARVGGAMAALLETGVPIAPALTAGAQAAGDAAIAARVTTVRRAVIAGSSLSRAFTDAEAATPTIVRLVRAGEESGQSSAALRSIRYD